MGDSLKKVKSGDALAIPASTFNAFVDAARDFQSRQLQQSRAASQSAPHTGIILVKNASGADRSRFDILGVDSPVFSPAEALGSFQSSVVVNGVTPTTASHAGRFVVLLEPLASNAIGKAVVAGAVPVQLTIDSDSDKFADVNNGQCGSLKSAKSGAAAILWKAAASGTVWAIVRIGAGGGVEAGTAVTPAVLLPAAFETEAAQADTWGRDNPSAGTDGVSVRLQTRSAYNEAGDQKLYAYYREFVFDSRGCMKSISAETRVIVDTPGSYPS